ncbi:MAG: hypothetical protein HWQ35_19125 [Nostoc sp. NMS1]|uniref:hypothetical protein n=1 Tax=unclassified Nostoc TaxID=2593658 RepID=UPI0025DCB687|nr:MULTISPECIES: hypothetical protein [unclassified Nostoc]MBN3908571.1 hypothetical protein [Nostoc sp. NMS1]MBN3994555.1 hypothetical protein [Nostoc sp. NMS2]
MLKTVAVALALLIPVSALAAEPYSVNLTENQYIQYEIELKQFFSTPILAKNAGKYLRASNAERRAEGQMTCSLLTAFTTEKYLVTQFEIHRTQYGDDPQKLDDEIAYTLGVTAAAIDTMCTEHRAELMDFFANFKQITTAGTSSQNRKP